MIDCDKVGFTLHPLSAMVCSQHFPSIDLAPNARGEPRPEAAAKRTLEGVGSSAWFGGATLISLAGFTATQAPSALFGGCVAVEVQPLA
jgi:hypothetical protein